jgi:hypothetical protein
LAPRRAFSSQTLTSRCRSATAGRQYELANRLRELVTLPPALKSSCGLALTLRRGSTSGLDRIGSSTEFVCGDVRDGPGLARSVCGMPCCSTQVSGRAHCMAARRASLHHLDLPTRPSAGMLDRLTRSWVLRLRRLEKVKNVLCARRRPESEEMVIRIGEGPTAADRHEASVTDLREDHGWNFYHLHPPNTPGQRARPGTPPSEACEPGGRSATGRSLLLEIGPDIDASGAVPSDVAISPRCACDRRRRPG